MTHPITPLRVYGAVFAALLLLLLSSVGLHCLDLGIWNTVLALGIAGTQAFLAVVFFMNVRFSGRLIWIFAGIGFYWMAILLVLSMSDFVSRTWPPFGGR